MTVELKLENAAVTAGLKLQEKMTGEISISAGKEVYREQVGGVRDYEKLDNLPKLDGATIIGDVKERDPTVPLWAKSTSKPVYTPDEIEMKPIALTDLEVLFDNL